jgi:hypothetical protein
MQAVQSALNGKNPVGDFRELSRLVAGDPDAKAGLQRAVAEYLVQRVVREPVGGAETGTMNLNALNAVMKRDMALGQVFAPEQMQGLKALSADLQRSSMPLPKGQGAASPAPGKLSLLSHLGEGIAGVSGYLLGGVHGAFEGIGAYRAIAMAKPALDAMKRAGIDEVNKLLTDALLNPELAKTLMMKATAANRPFIAQRLASQLGMLAGSDAANENRRQSHPVATRPAPRVAARPALPPTPGPGLWGSMVPGGALRRAVR